MASCPYPVKQAPTTAPWRYSLTIRSSACRWSSMDRWRFRRSSAARPGETAGVVAGVMSPRPVIATGPARGPCLPASIGDPAAVHGHARPGDVAGVFGGEEGRDPGDFLGGA